MVFYIVLTILLIIALIVVFFLVYERNTNIKEIKAGELDSELIYDRHIELEKRKKHKILKKSLDIGLDVLIVLLGVLFVTGTVDKIINTSALPLKSVVIASGSMSVKNEENDYLFENKLDNQIQVNDLIFLTKVESLDEIELYDIICYLNEDNLRIVHRVVEIHDTYLKTRGDANNATDLMNITLDRVVGKYNGAKIPGIGSFTFFITSDYGIATISIIFVLSLVYYFVKSSIEKEEDKRIKYLEEEISSLKDYKLISSSGNLIVKDDHYEYEENKEDITITSLLEADGISKELKKEK